MNKDTLTPLPEQSMLALASILDNRASNHTDPYSQNNVFWAAVKNVAIASHINIETAPPLINTDSMIESLDIFAENYAFRYRQVDLIDQWWHFDHGPLLVFDKQRQLPGALIPDRKGTYHLLSYSSDGEHSSQRLTQSIANSLETFAYSFYRCLPDQNINWRELLTFGIKNVRLDIKQLLFASAMVALLGLLVPIATQVLIDQIIPNADINLLQQLVIALICNVLAITLFRVASTLASMRLQLKMNASLQAALWDRMLRLPVNFFRRFSVGDLANRADSIDTIQQTLTGSVISSFINGLFSIVTLALMAYYDWRLALLGAVLTLIFCLFNILTTLMQLKYQRKMFKAQGQLSGIVLQFLGNITKLRFANKEAAAFTLWSHHFRKINDLFLKSEKIHIALKVFSSVFPLLSTAAVYFMVVKLGNSMSFGNFIGFNSAYGQFTAAVLGLSAVIADSLSIIPLYERAQPILSTLPENNNADINLDQLNGDIQLKNLSFHYPQDPHIANDKQLPWIFNDISINIKSGQKVALVGPSGCGKSSLFRLLLGFESPQYGSIYFDGHKLDTLNKNSIRRQIGVVLQNSTLLPGTILDNILMGAYAYDKQIAWEAATAACIDEEIKAMPMGMQTIIAEAGSNLSKGQQQRLLIAQALAKKPKLLFLDEATSALDNITQAKITEHLEKLNISCLVAAHRLSTIANADQIYVFEKGEIVQQGTFEQLSQQTGLFAAMMENQIIQDSTSNNTNL